MFINFKILICLLTGVSGQITSIENADGSYSIGLTSYGRGDIGESVLGLLSQSSGWTPNSLKHDRLRENKPTNPNNRDLIENSIRRTVDKVASILKRGKYMIPNFLGRLFALVSDYLRYVHDARDASVNSWFKKRFGRT